MDRRGDALHLTCAASAGAAGRAADASRRARRPQDTARQVARLEQELAQLFCSIWPRKGFTLGVAGRGGPRLLSLAELEELRDDLAALRAARPPGAVGSHLHRGAVPAADRGDAARPEGHKWVRVANEDIGEPGCKHWHVRPRWSLIGMLMGWWRVVISSGCPLAA